MHRFDSCHWSLCSRSRMVCLAYVPKPDFIAEEKGVQVLLVSRVAFCAVPVGR